MIWMLLLLLVTLLCYILYIVWIFAIDERKMRKDAPYVGSYVSHRKLLVQYRAKIHWNTILDMWCWDGWILRLFIKKMWYKSWTWYDIRRFPIWLGRIIHTILWYKHIQLYQQDFHKAQIHKYDTIYLFLWADIVVQLEKRIHDSIRPWAVVITNTFHFKTREPFDTIKNSKGKMVFQLYKKA